MNITRRGFLQLFGKAVAVAAATPVAARVLPQTIPPEPVRLTAVGAGSKLVLRETPKIADGLVILEWRLEHERDYRVDRFLGGDAEISTGRRLARLEVRAYMEDPMMYTRFLEEEDVPIEGSGYPGLDGKWKLVKFALSDGYDKLPLQDLHFIRLYDPRFP